MNRVINRHTGIWLMMFFAQLVIVAYAVVTNDSLVEALHTMARLSGRVSLVLFCLIFVHYSPNDRIKNAFFVFAIAHGIHLIELVSYQFLKSPGGQLISVRAAGGFVAYFFIFLTPVLHQLEDRGKIRYVNMVKFEQVYIYFIWVIFFLTYLPRILGRATTVGGSYYEFIIAFSLVLAVMMIRLFSTFRRRSVQS